MRISDWSSDVCSADLLKAGFDETGEFDAADLAGSTIRFSSDPGDLAGTTFFVVAVPTPIDDNRRPDLGALLSACRTVGRALRPGAVVVFEIGRASCRERECQYV